MGKYALAAFALIGGVMLFIYFGIGRTAPEREQFPPLPPPHHARNTNQALKEINVRAVYFVPKGKVPIPENQWKENLLERFKLLKKFHALAFQGRSTLEYALYPTPITGLREHLFYDTNRTDDGNPEGLRSISEELESRLFSREGDLYDESFAKTAGYRVLYIIYEGVGASGAEGVALLSRKFLTESEYKTERDSFFAHEFYHTLGILDGYKHESGAPTSNDLMGAGRLRPLTETFLSTDVAELFGI